MAHRYCDGVQRRDFLKAGALGTGLSLASYLRLAKAGAVKPSAAKAAIFVNLAGGPSHADTFDLKPGAPDTIRGEFRPIDTKSPGVQISEHLPKLASHTDKFAILRGVSHSVAAHELGSKYMNTGNRPLPSLEFPGYGAVVSKELPGTHDLPPFVAIPTTPQRAGYLGVRYAPLSTNAVPRVGKPFTVRGVAIAGGLTLEKVAKRQKLLSDLDTLFDGYEAANGLVDGLDQFDEQAYQIISSSRARDAFDVAQEKAEIAQEFGDTNFGQSCLLSLRLIEAGVRFTTINFGGWDTHRQNFSSLKDKLLPQLDQGLAGLFKHLELRGLLDSTVVFVTGEFGRTPKINKNAGRDHWPRAMFVLLGGGPVRGGQVVGASDEQAMGPAGDPITPDQVGASFYHALGINYEKEYHTNTGRPVMIVREGSLIPGLLA